MKIQTYSTKPVCRWGYNICQVLSPEGKSTGWWASVPNGRRTKRSIDTEKS